MTKDNKSKFNFNVLIVEDREEDLDKLNTFFRDIFSKSINIEIRSARNAEQAQNLLKSKVFQLLSLDQRLPKSTGDELMDENGLEVGDLALKTQPLIIPATLTAYPHYLKSTKLAGVGFDYFPKGQLRTSEYVNILAAKAKSFIDEGVWEKASDILPGPIAHFAGSFSPNVKQTHLERFIAIRSLWEAGIRLLLFSGIATLDTTGVNISKILPTFSKIERFDNAAILRSLNVVFEALDDTLKKNNRYAEAREYKRFFCEPFLSACREIQVLRNESAHSPAEITAEIIKKNQLTFITFLVGMSFWAIHPIVNEMSLISVEGRYVVKGSSKKGTRSINEFTNWEWDGKLVVKSNYAYQLITEPEEEKAPPYFVPLYPLVRLEKRQYLTDWWIAHRPLHNEYKNPVTGKTRIFPDIELRKWWMRRF